MVARPGRLCRVRVLLLSASLRTTPGAFLGNLVPEIFLLLGGSKGFLMRLYLGPFVVESSPGGLQGVLRCLLILGAVSLVRFMC